MPASPSPSPACGDFFTVGEHKLVYAAGVPVSVTMTGPLIESVTALLSVITDMTKKKRQQEHPSSLRLLVGISGPAGAGKSTLAAMLVDVLNAKEPDTALLLSVDGYHKTNDILDTEDQRSDKGRPLTFNIDSFVRDIAAIKGQSMNSEPIVCPVYDRPSHNPRRDGVTISPPPRFHIIIVEGILLYTSGHGFGPLYTRGSGVEDKDDDGLLDLRVYLDLPESEARARVNGRKLTEGELDHRAVEEHYRRVDYKNHMEMDHSKSHAHVICVPDERDPFAYTIDPSLGSIRTL